MYKSKRGFTLVELLVATIVASILVSVTVSLYGLIRKSMAQDQAKADLAQNARVSLDRISRELRQANSIVTNLPASPADNSVAEPHEIEFEDGHANDLTYKRYYLNGSVLEMDVMEYYFAGSPNTRVSWDATNNGVSPISAVISTEDIADMVQTINFYEGATLLAEIITTDSASQTYSLETSVEARN